MHIIGSIVLACQSQKQLMLWAFMPASRKPLALRPKSARSYLGVEKKIRLRHLEN